MAAGSGCPSLSSSHWLGPTAGLVTANDSTRYTASAHGQVKSAKKRAPKPGNNEQQSVTKASDYDLTTQPEAMDPILVEKDDSEHARHE